MQPFCNTVALIIMITGNKHSLFVTEWSTNTQIMCNWGNACGNFWDSCASGLKEKGQTVKSG